MALSRATGALNQVPCDYFVVRKTLINGRRDFMLSPNCCEALQVWGSLQSGLQKTCAHVSSTLFDHGIDSCFIVARPPPAGLATGDKVGGVKALRLRAFFENFATRISF
jgi:hypothetical protein